MIKLKGCYTALVTPFNNGDIDWTTLEEIIEIQVNAGVAGIVPMGTTGESPTVSFKEHREIIEKLLK